MSELFETFDDDGRYLGLVARHEVHARGLWHRSAHVLLFTADGRLHIQRRAADKDLYADRWDLSVGEHLAPGESYLEGALRGLREELGVTGARLTTLGAVRRQVCDIPEHGLHDRELQQAFRGTYDGPITPDPAEVAAVDVIALDALRAWMTREPEAFTPWLLKELDALQ